MEELHVSLAPRRSNRQIWTPEMRSEAFVEPEEYSVFQGTHWELNMGSEQGGGSMSLLGLSLCTRLCRYIPNRTIALCQLEYKIQAWIFPVSLGLSEIIFKESIWELKPVRLIYFTYMYVFKVTKKTRARFTRGQWRQVPQAMAGISAKWVFLIKGKKI